MLHHRSLDTTIRFRNARRFFSIVPLVIFVLALMLFSSADRHSYFGFLNVLFRSTAVSMASIFVSIAAYWFYRYLRERSPGL